MATLSKTELAAHLGHDLQVATYAEQNITLECITCYQVILDYELEND